METYVPAAVQGSVDVDLYQAFRLKLSDVPSWTAKIQILSVILFFLSGFPLVVLALWNGKAAGSFSFESKDVGIWFVTFASWPAIIILHELIHGLIMSIFGIWPQFGVRLKHLVFYATAPGYAFRRNAYLNVLFTPLVGLSVLALLGISLLQGTAWAILLAFCAAFNFAGAAGDLALARMVLVFSDQAYIVDEPDGFRV